MPSLSKLEPSNSRCFLFLPLHLSLTVLPRAKASCHLPRFVRSCWARMAYRGTYGVISYVISEYIMDEMDQFFIPGWRNLGVDAACGASIKPQGPSTGHPWNKKAELPSLFQIMNKCTNKCTNKYIHEINTWISRPVGAAQMWHYLLSLECRTLSARVVLVKPSSLSPCSSPYCPWSEHRRRGEVIKW